ncbi:MAG: carbon storage regulator [Legionellaceae bacterium]|nr:carbon storage regulator [Legionellaceae bacterium]
MDIYWLNFESSLIIELGEQVVSLTAFRAADPEHIKFGVEAPRSVPVNREEVFYALKAKEAETMSEES